MPINKQLYLFQFVIKALKSKYFYHTIWKIFDINIMHSQKLTKLSTITLHTGRTIPRIGLGTYLLTGQHGVSSIIAALQNGYTHLDTASMYGNERQIKQAIAKLGIQRSKLYITSKVGPDQHGSKKARQAVNNILDALGCGYLDLILIHWPGSYDYKGSDPKNQQIRLQTWKTLIELQKQGKVKDIGVSNFLKHHLQDLLKHSQHRPVVNQIQIHPLLWQGPTIEFCRQNNIALEAYSPLAHNNSNLFKNKILSQIAKKHNKSLAQICLRWGIQHDFIILPKSSNQQRLKQNISIYDFQLSAQQMATIQQQTHKNIRTDWNPHSIKF